jgi:hypothetical protein
MPKYLYIFSYQTPEQMETARKQGYTDEASEAVFIEAESPERALDWGREISEEFVRRRFGSQGVSWKSSNFAHWVETQPQQEYPAAILACLPVVACGSFPELDGFKR